MKTFTELKDLFTNLSNNETTENNSLGGQLISDRHRYLIQKYFDNERVYTTTTVGAQDLTLTGTPAANSTSATLSSPWTYPTCTQLAVFGGGVQRTVSLTKGSTAVTWQPALTDAADDNTLATVGVQAYAIPATVSKVKNDTITVGQLVYTPAPIQSIQEWTLLNAMPYTSDIPNYFYIYNNQVLFWPIPSTTGNVITFNYKSRVPDLSFEDYSTGTLSGLAVGGTTITGVSTSWNTTGLYPLNTDVGFFNLHIKIDPPNGDGLWYPIKSFESNTSLTLYTPLQNAPSATATSYTIGQLPLLQEDFHDMLVFGALKIYFSSLVKDQGLFEQYQTLEAERMALLEDYAGTKSVNVDLGMQPVPNNPNLFIYANQQP